MLPSWIKSRNCNPRLVYFLAIEMTKRKLASIISFLALREERSPSFMRLLMSLSSAKGTTTRVWMSVSFCCNSWMAGILRVMVTDQVLAAPDCFSTHLRFNKLTGNSLMNMSCGIPQRSTMMRRSSRSFLRTSSTCERTKSQSFSIVRAVKRTVINSSLIDFWIFK